MVESNAANKYTEEWASGLCTGDTEGQYVELVLKDGSVFCPYEWSKF